MAATADQRVNFALLPPATCAAIKMPEKKFNKMLMISSSPYSGVPQAKNTRPVRITNRIATVEKVNVCRMAAPQAANALA